MFQQIFFSLSPKKDEEHAPAKKNKIGNINHSQIIRREYTHIYVEKGYKLFNSPKTCKASKECKLFNNPKTCRAPKKRKKKNR